MKQESNFKRQNNLFKASKYIKSNIYNYAVQNKKVNDIAIIQREHLIILAMIYGGLIEDGKRTINDYKFMNMRSFGSELSLRTLMLKSERLRLEKADKAERMARERDLFEQLKRNQ